MTPIITTTAKSAGTTMASYSNADLKNMAITGIIVFVLLLCLLAYNYFISKK